MSTKYWTDIYGRWHNKEVSSPNVPPSNNAYTYTATAHLLHMPIDGFSMYKCYRNSLTLFSFNRHPDRTLPPTSRDEIQGALILNLIDPQRLIDNSFYFCNIGVPAPASLWTKAKLLWSIRKSHRNAIWSIPELWGFAFTLPRQDQYFVWRVSKKNPGAFLALFFLISSILTLRKNTASGMQILWQKLEYLRQYDNLTWIERKLLNCINMRQVIEAYYPLEHPFVKNLKP